MKHLIILLLMVVPFSQHLCAQEETTTIDNDTAAVVRAAHQRLPQEEAMRPILAVSSPALSPFSPFYGEFLGSTWALHSGFNAQFGMSATIGFGKHAPHGVGFGQNVALAYVRPVSNRLLFAAGIYANHMKWGGYGTTDVGVGVMADYRVNDRLDVYAYATASLMPNRDRLWSPYYWDTPAKYRVGMGANWKVNDTFSLGLSVEASRHEGFNPFYTEDHSLLKPYRGLDW